MGERIRVSGDQLDASHEPSIEATSADASPEDQTPETHRRRPAVDPRNLTAGVLLIIIAAGIGIYFSTMDRAVATRGLNEGFANLHQEMINELEENGGIAPSGARARAYLQVLDDAVVDLADRDQKALRAVREAVAPLVQTAERHAQALQAFEAAGGLEFATLATPADCQHRLRLIDELADANDALTRIAAAYADEVGKRLGESGASADEIAKVLAAGRVREKFERVVAVRELDRRLIRTWAQIFRLLEDQWGEWVCEPDSGSLIFAEDAPREAFGQLLHEMQELAVEQRRLQREFLRKP